MAKKSNSSVAGGKRKWGALSKGEREWAYGERMKSPPTPYGTILDRLRISNDNAGAAMRQMRQAVANMGGKPDADKALSEMDARILGLLRSGPMTVRDVADAIDRSPRTVEETIARLTEAGYPVHSAGERVSAPSVPDTSDVRIPALWEAGVSRIAWASLSDIHAGSKYVQRTALRCFIDRAMGEYGVRHFLVSGDVVAGTHVYRGQEYDLYATGADEQIEEACDVMPEADGVKWYLLGGNHDASFYGRVGLDVIGRIASMRPDVTHCGWASADVPLTDNAVVRMHHPRGSLPYALCLSDDTEILTERGWVGIDTVSMADKAATLNPVTLEVEYQKLDGMYVGPYTGKMVHIQSRTVDHLVTPDHDLWVRRYNEGKDTGEWHKVRAASLVENYGHKQFWQLMIGGTKWNGEERQTFKIPFREWSGARDLGDMPMDSFLTFLGWYLSEGCISNGKTIVITQSDHTDFGKSAIIEIIKCMQEIGLRVHVRYEKTEGRQHIKRIDGYNNSLVAWLKSHCCLGARNKRVPRMVMELSSRQIGIFLDALFAGDGTKEPGRRWFVYNSASRGLRDDVQELLIKVGYGGTIHHPIEYGRQWKGAVGVLEQMLPTINVPPKIVDYNGRVWCVTVPNGLIYARRDGKPIWTGNSYRGQKYAAQIAFDELLRIVVADRPTTPKVRVLQIGHLHVMAGPFMQGPIDVVQAGCFEGQTIYMRERGLVPNIGGYIFEADVTDGGMIRELAIHRMIFQEERDDYAKRNGKRPKCEIEPMFRAGGENGE